MPIAPHHQFVAVFPIGTLEEFQAVMAQHPGDPMGVVQGSRHRVSLDIAIDILADRMGTCEAGGRYAAVVQPRHEVVRFTSYELHFNTERYPELPRDAEEAGWIAKHEFDQWVRQFTQSFPRDGILRNVMSATWRNGEACTLQSRKELVKLLDRKRRKKDSPASVRRAYEVWQMTRSYKHFCGN